MPRGQERSLVQSSSDSISPLHIALSVENFGPIAKADIKLRPLTVFVGPSNTGKTYLTVLLYALHRLYADDQLFWNGDSRSGHAAFARRLDQAAYRHELAKVLGPEIQRWVKNLPPSSATDLSPDALSVPVPLSKAIVQLFDDTSETGADLAAEIQRCLGLGDNAKSLIRKGSRRQPRIAINTLQTESTNLSEVCQFQFHLNGNRSAAVIESLGDINLHIGSSRSSRLLRNRAFPRSWLTEEPDMGDEENDFRFQVMFGAILRAILGEVVGDLGRDVLYLPPDRTGIMHAHRAVVSSIVRQAPYALQRRLDLPSVSGVMSDFLERLIEIDTIDKNRNPEGDALASQLEESLLNGRIEVEPSESGYPSFFYRPFGWTEPLPLLHSSSMVSELAPVVLALRHYLEAGDTIIIEEPESHLHPAAQSTFTRFLAKLVHANIHVIITTHSDWVLEQCANLVHMSGLTRKERSGLIGDEDALSPEQFGAWLFEPKQSPRGSVVSELAIDPRSGGLVRDYREVLDDTYNTWAEISNRIADREM